MSEKRKLIVLKITRIILSAIMTILNALEADGQKIDKSVLEQEIPEKM